MIVLASFIGISSSVMLAYTLFTVFNTVPMNAAATVCIAMAFLWFAIGIGGVADLLDDRED
jgi:hypothetical protein|tara:strand:+ start:4239 stop:4421 length:183 start_codon:yes stop_codon:yes gene_type:complete